MGHHYSAETKAAVLKLGKTGKSYTEIRKLFPIPKSTLSVWFKNAGKKPPSREKQLAHLSRIRLIASATKRRQKKEWVDKAGVAGLKEAAKLNLSDKTTLKALLAMLYWSEGSKHPKVYGLIFTNTDPTLLFLYISLLRATYPIDESRFRVRLHLHYYHSHKEAIRFWSERLQIPSSQFGKIHVKKRSVQKKFRRNFQGICFVSYPDSAAREELLAMGRELSKRFEK